MLDNFYLKYVNGLIISYFIIITCNNPNISHFFILRQTEKSNKL
jgi:hypothetical protein